jgi:hypothetical protein
MRWKNRASSAVLSGEDFNTTCRLPMNALFLLLQPANCVAALLIALMLAINIGVRRTSMSMLGMLTTAVFCNGIAISLVCALNWLSTP